jgi:uncharacterized membrane protein YkvA (DUF1232 family)
MIPNFVNPKYWRSIWTEIQLVYKLVKDKRVPLYLKVIPLLVVVYLVSPLELVPAFIPVVGQMDDLAMLMLGLKAFTYLTPKHIVAEYLPAKESMPS